MDYAGSQLQNWSCYHSGRMWGSSGDNHDSGVLEKSGVPTVLSASKRTASGISRTIELSVLTNSVVVKLKCAVYDML